MHGKNVTVLKWLNLILDAQYVELKLNPVFKTSILSFLTCFGLNYLPTTLTICGTHRSEADDTSNWEQTASKKACM